RAQRGICCRGQFIRIAGQQVPGFAVFLIRSTVDSLLASRVKMNEFTVKNGIHWNHIPSVVRRYEGGDEVDLVARIGYTSAQRAAGNGDRVRIEVISRAVGEKRIVLKAQVQ